MTGKLSSKEFLAKMQEYEEFLRANSGAVREYWFNKRFEQDLAETRRLEREEAEIKGERKGIKKGKIQGRAEGKAEGTLENARNLRKQGILTIEQIAEALNLPVKTLAN